MQQAACRTVFRGAESTGHAAQKSCTWRRQVGFGNKWIKMQENEQMYPILDCLSGNFTQKWEAKSHLERSLLCYFKIDQNGCISNMINIFRENSSLACIPQWVTSSLYPVSSLLLFCPWRKCSSCVNTAGFSGAVRRQSLSCSLTQERKTGSSETLWMILAVVTCFWSWYMVLIMLFYLSALWKPIQMLYLFIFLFLFLEMPP